MAVGETPPPGGGAGSPPAASGENAAPGYSAPSSPPPATMRLWQEVQNGIDKHQTVVWRNAVDSLSQGYKYIQTSNEARAFIESYMRPVISILLEQHPSKIGQNERNCVEESLRLSVMIVAQDLKAKADVSAGECKVLEVLASVFDRKKIFYKGSKTNWNQQVGGLPDVRLQMVNKFRSVKGLALLATYLSARASSPQLFPPIESLHKLLSAIADSVPSPIPNQGSTEQQAQAQAAVDGEVIHLAQSVMDFLSSAAEEYLKHQTHDMLFRVREDLQRIFERVGSRRRRDVYSFYEFWRSLVLKLITSQSLPLKLFGWEEVDALLKRSAGMRPPPRAFEVSGAGCPFVNGRYEFSGTTDGEGFAVPTADLKYELVIPDTVPEADGGGKKLTLFRCTMRSQQKWWFLSEADEDQPGTDKDIDYYQHKSKQHEEAEPPRSGWVTCRNSGVDPPPKLKPSGLMVPREEMYNTLEHQLAKWAIENKVIELVLGDSVHREIVSRSTPLVTFLASMCARDEPLDGSDVGGADLAPNRYCLDASHLLLAWKTCTSKADTAVSAEVYRLLVTILPTLPADLAIHLLRAIHDSLRVSKDKRKYLYEVAEFCGALALAYPVDPNAEGNAASKAATIHAISEGVRGEILQLLWAVLMHPDASSLKNYESLKDYVRNELRFHPKYRMEFLGSCRQSLEFYAGHASATGTETINENVALRMVKLTRFVLEACPHEEASRLVTSDDAALARLLLKELSTYLQRRTATRPTQASSQLSTKSSSISVSVTDSNHTVELSERLHIIRYAYGLSDLAVITSEQLNHLWSLCVRPEDREAFMIFLANASNADRITAQVKDESTQSQHPQAVTLKAAFSDDVRLYAFQTLFCSTSADWEDLGAGAYQSFQLLFQSLRGSGKALLSSNGPALDALWRICLSAGRDDVASQAMKDLLAVYSAIGLKGQKMDGIETAPMVEKPEESFSRRVFDCLVKVKEGLEAGELSSERSAERCLRILNAALGHGSSEKTSFGSVSSACLESISSCTSVSDALRSIPHGMRGQANYLTIGIHAKRLTPNNTTSSSAPVLSSSALSVAANPATIRFALDVHPLETLASVRTKVAKYCNHKVDLVKPISVNGGRATSGYSKGENASQNLNQEPDNAIVADLGITRGCEVVFLLALHPLPASSSSSSAKESSQNGPTLDDLGEIVFAGNGSADGLFEMLLDVLEALPAKGANGSPEYSNQAFDSYELVWNILRSMPTNSGVVERVERAAQMTTSSRGDTAMRVDIPRQDWSVLLDRNFFHRSVYTMQVIDSFLQPAPELLSSLEEDKCHALQSEMQRGAVTFRQGFIKSGGFDAVMKFFTESDRGQRSKRRKTEMGNTIALRVLKCCLFGNVLGTATAFGADSSLFSSSLDDLGQRLLTRSISNPKTFLESLTSRMIADSEVTDAAILDALQLLRLMLLSNAYTTKLFVTLPNAENFVVITLLLWERRGTTALASVDLSSRIRRGAEDLILTIPALSQCVLPWLIKAIDKIDSNSDSTEEFFSVLQMLVEGRYRHSQIDTTGGPPLRPTPLQLRKLSTAVCKKIATNPRQSGDNTMINFSGGVLCGCLKLLRALVESGGGTALVEGVVLLTGAFKTKPWSQLLNNAKSDDNALIDLMGAMFDGYLSNAESSSSSPLSFDKESRRLGFNVITAAARSCNGGDGYLVLVTRISRIISAASPSLRHRWGHNVSTEEGRNTRTLTNTSRFTGLRNQGCTCYMNSVLQQLFMMPGFRENLCSALLPSSLRSCGVGSVAKGADLVGKTISVHWENGASYEAKVEDFDTNTGMHTIQYSPPQLPTGGGPQTQNHHQPPPFHPDEIACLPDEMPEELFLHEGRPGKESGVFDILPSDNMDVSDGDGKSGAGESSSEEGRLRQPSSSSGIQEKEDEASSRRLLEEVQRTFVHLAEGLHGRCFDPRSLVEASAVLKLEFDVWQQNDASEFAMKLLDRLEVPLKRWSPQHFKYLENTFGLKQTKQKICKKCGLKTNREEHFMNIDCQIRGKSDVHEALSTLCEVEFMEGDNRVFCDRCKEKCDTVLRTAISRLPNTLVLSLKRFDLDYNTFETVKLNSRCSFGHTLNMKRYTLEGVERMEKANEVGKEEGVDPMAESSHSGSEGASDPLASLPDEDYEYKLAGVLVHAGVAQGGHYYSFIRDRVQRPGESRDKWYRFDDEDVTPFDPSQIEVECFGGKVKKETKFPNGQVHTVESEQFANALMLFYEKVKPSDNSDDDNDSNKDGDGSKDVPMDEQDDSAKQVIETTSGYDVFQQDVQRSNKTHGWLDFLFDAEFQDLLKGLVDRCLISCDNVPSIEAMDVSTSLSLSPQEQVRDGSSSQWRLALLQLLLSYVFDILLHSTDKAVLNAWTEKLVDALSQNKDGAKSFVYELANRTRMVSSNWLRTYCADCPEKASREAAIQIFLSGIHSSASFLGEQQALQKWAKAWKSQVAERETLFAERRARPGPMPTMLEGSWQALEDVNRFEDGSSSSLGVIISFLTHLLEVAPRTWRYNADLCILIREMSCLKTEGGAHIIRDAMVEAQIPARLVCLAIRDQAAPVLRIAFPGASQRFDVADAMTKTETAPSSHLMPLAGSAVGVGGIGGNATMPSPSDYLTLFEALGCLIGAQFVKGAPVVQETGGRLELSEELSEALTIVFREMMTPNVGMGQQDIIKYLKLCGHDVSNVTLSQRITNILTKYPTTGGIEGGREARFLTLDGFLAYYRDTTQTNDAHQVRADLIAFGFRPDFTRIPEEHRVYVSADRKRKYQLTESVAYDVTSMRKNGAPIQVGTLAEVAFQCFQLYNLAYSCYDYIGEYLLACFSYGRDTSMLLIECLKALSHAPSGWGGSELICACLMVMKVLSAIPDERQQERISTIMQSVERAHPHSGPGIGLLVAAKDILRTSRHSQQYQAGAFERYVDVLKDLQKQREVRKWMSEHQSLWNWMEQWLYPEVRVAPQQQQGYDSVGRDVGVTNVQSVPIGHNHSDSDMNTGIHDSDDDDDSRFDQDGHVDARIIVVQGAGTQELNGIYRQHGSVDDAMKYSKAGIFDEREVTFSIFRCRLSDDTRRWYISIVPKNVLPGTNKDIDFYSAPASDQCQFPPENTWSTANGGRGHSPSPVLTYKSDRSPDGNDDINGGQVWNGDGDDAMEDDAIDGQDVGYL